MDWQYFMLNSLLYLSVALLGIRGGEITADEVCRICEGCTYGSISCQEADLLHMLPNDLPNGIEKVIIVSQRFDSQFLSRQNISSYTLPGVNIHELTIMHCGLRAIEAGTFSGLSSLTKLDLSKNSLSRIQGHTFSGLRLDLLRLDDNQGLTLDSEAFENLTVSSLSMQNCGLRSLSYEVFQPLVQSRSLTTLRLTSNSLTTLDARFEPFFRNLSFLSLARNPFVCDCKLVWLSQTLQRKRRADSDDAFRRLNDDRLLIVPDDDHPVCESPNRLRGKQIVSLSTRDFFCGPPQMRTLEVDFSDLRVGQSETFNMTGVVLIKCAAQGSPEMQLAWFRRDGRGDEPIRLPGLRQVASGVVEVSISHSLLAKNSNSETEDAGQLFTCLGVDTYGNTSADLSLRWPALPLLSPLPSSPTSNNRNPMEPSSGDSKYLNNDKGYFQSDHLDEFFFMKKFTILELIGAVVGTFTATILLFLMGYILLYMRHRQQCPKSPSKTVYPLVTSTGLPKFPDYQVLESSPQHPIQGPLEAIGNQSCDLATEKRRLMAKTEWTDARRGPEARTSSGVYSECPTYDLPSNHMASAPLPPLPLDPPPPSPPSKTSQFGTVSGVPIVYPQPHFLDPATAAAAAAAATGNGNSNQSNSLLAQTLTTNAILVDMLTMQRRQRQLQQQQQQVSALNQEFRF
ncbi:Immunoglobulin superfamily member [Echinococcus granulosus]|uniref:Immunoglobulin superfamily member n=1 Tax=Echinococcus granulosus TaxID=6210 RepID=W6U6F3_ECHGR|nr:Immunoglobulin superfamily member [Echinococcus granulosus]EUB56770.1 Immunoglobulin superfamily member [Echinococcus granulosus]